MDENKTNNTNEDQDPQSIEQQTTIVPGFDSPEPVVHKKKFFQRKLVIVLLIVGLIAAAYYAYDVIPRSLSKKDITAELKAKYPLVGSVKSLRTIVYREACRGFVFYPCNSQKVTSYQYDGDLYIKDASFTVPFRISVDVGEDAIDEGVSAVVLDDGIQNIGSFVSMVNKTKLDHIESYSNILAGSTFSNSQEYESLVAIGYKLKNLYVIRQCESNHNSIKMCGSNNDGSDKILPVGEDHLVYYDDKLDKWVYVNNYPDKIIDWWFSQATPILDDTIWLKSPLKPYGNN